MLPSEYACPRCTCTACYALHRKGFDWAMSLIGLRPARCLTCNKRFYARYTIAGSEPQPPRNEATLGAVTAPDNVGASPNGRKADSLQE